MSSGVEVQSRETNVIKNKLSIGGYLKQYWQRVKSGDLGNLPIILGLALIGIIFQTQDDNFLTPRNLVTLIQQMAPITAIAYGVVFVLLIGEIDLSIGFVSAVAGVSVALLLRGISFQLPIVGTMIELQGLSWWQAIILGLFVVGLIGLLQGSVITYLKVPSFIVTLAGLLAWNGVVLNMIGGSGTVIIQDDVVAGIANSFLPPIWGWIVAALFVGSFTLVELLRYQGRKSQGLAPKPLGIILFQVVLLAVIGIIVVSISNQDRGVPTVGVILLIFLAVLTFVAEETQFGRFVYAVGGNEEAARRAGINVNRIRLAVFTISSVMAGVGGIILASRLRSVATNTGGGNLLLNSIAAAVIGGTSLFGGDGRVTSAILGAAVIASVDNGMGLLGLSSGNKFIITGFVLLVAVIVDSFSRRRQKQAGIG